MATKKNGHTFTILATHENGDEWSWCIRCGVVKIGDSFFVPGAKQRKVLRCAIATPKCIRSRSWPSL